MVKEILDRIPKSFLLGISLASILWGIVMVLHLSLPKSGSPEESGKQVVDGSDLMHFLLIEKGCHRGKARTHVQVVM